MVQVAISRPPHAREHHGLSHTSLRSAKPAPSRHRGGASPFVTTDKEIASAQIDLGSHTALKSWTVHLQKKRPAIYFGKGFLLFN